MKNIVGLEMCAAVRFHMPSPVLKTCKEFNPLVVWLFLSLAMYSERAPRLNQIFALEPGDTKGHDSKGNRSNVDGESSQRTFVAL